jgi:hypothetical protein
MGKQNSKRDDGWEAEEPDEVQFEKIARRQRHSLPVSSSKAGGRSAKETLGSRRVRRSISQKAGGIHRRRNKKAL